MSTFKKVISLVLCVAMLAGSFAFAGDLAATVASAEEPNIGATRTVKTATAKNEELIQTKVEGIPSYADLVASYGTNTGADGLTDGFLYIGAEYYEADGKLTDYYVQPGDKLTARVYVKSNMYTADATIISLFNNSHWDVKVAAEGANKFDKNGYTSGYETPGNSNHPAWTTNGYKNAVTSINITNAGWIKNTCGFDAKYLAATDLVQVQSKVDSGVSSMAYQDTSDIWKLTYIVTVKEGLADGTEIKIESPDVIWASYLNGTKHDTRKRAYIANSHITATDISSTASCKTMASQMDSGSLDYFILDLNKTFVIGKPAEAVKYAVNFYENDGTTAIGTAAEYEEGAAVTFPAAAENQIAWALIKEGLATPGTLLAPAADGSYSYTTKAADVSFMRVLADDKFDVELSLGKDATVDETVALPEGVTYNKDKNALVVALPVGGSFDLASIPAEALQKKDNTFKDWDVSGVTGASTVEGTVITLGNVNGKGGTTVTAKAAATWETASYKVRYFLNKEAYENGEAPVHEETIVAGEKATYNGENLIDDLKFAGWYRADTNEVVNDKKVVVGTYTYSKDLDFYADWSEYANMATFMIRDYENGSGWKVAYIDKSDAEGDRTINKVTLKTIKDNAVDAAGANFAQMITDIDPELIPEGETLRDHIAAPYDGAGGFAKDLVYSGHKVYYILTTMTYSVTWKVPVYDAEAGAFTEETTDYTATVSTAYTPTNGIDPYFATAKFTEKVTNPTGWEITGWIDEATGEAAEFNENGAYVLKGIENKSASLKAVYSLIEYPVAFNIQNSGAPDIVTMVGTVTLGGEITIEGKEFTINDTTATLPEVGVSSEDQNVSGYVLPAGYIFKGWALSGDTVVDFPVKVTEEIIKTKFVFGAIRFDAVWEAKEYSLKFYILNAEGNEELYSEHTVKVGDNLAGYKEVSAEKSADINSKAPEGKSFSNIWINKETGASDTNTKMPAKDVVYVGSYVNSSVKVYIDLNTTGDLNADIQEFKETSLIFGQDITEVKEEMPYGHRSFETMVQRSVFASANETPSEIVGWNIYHVHSTDNLYNKDKWEAGVNDEGTNNASATLIFQPIWVAHKDMFFRAYDTDDNIYIAMGKNFKLYFWNTGAIVDSYRDTQYNTNPDLNVVLFHTVEIDWDNLTVRFDAFPIPKSVFTLEGMLGIFEMLGNLLGSLL